MYCVDVQIVNTVYRLTFDSYFVSYFGLLTLKFNTMTRPVLGISSGISDISDLPIKGPSLKLNCCGLDRRGNWS